MSLIGLLLSWMIEIYIFIVIIQVVVSWLIAFNVLDVKNPQAQNLVRLLDRATEPVYKPLRKYIPPIGGIDLTPIVVIIAATFLKYLIVLAFF